MLKKQTGCNNCFIFFFLTDVRRDQNEANDALDNGAYFIFVYLYVSMYVCTYLSGYLSVCLRTYPSVCLFTVFYLLCLTAASRDQEDANEMPTGASGEGSPDSTSHELTPLCSSSPRFSYSIQH